MSDKLYSKLEKQIQESQFMTKALKKMLNELEKQRDKKSKNLINIK